MATSPAGSKRLGNRFLLIAPVAIGLLAVLILPLTFNVILANEGNDGCSQSSIHGAQKPEAPETGAFPPASRGGPGADGSASDGNREELRKLFTGVVEQMVRWNNWDMGCTDLQFLSPYFKAILDRLSWDQGRGTHLIFDVGANRGDDAASILGIFQPIRGMCKRRYTTPIKLFSVEPSPKVFCELVDTNITRAHEKVHLLNIALSDRTGSLMFKDPGNEGGKLVGTNFSDLSKMTGGDLTRMSQCQVPGHKHLSIDQKRTSTVPTYTLDLLVTSLEGLRKVNPSENIFVLKIDTEGHDYQVLLGANETLRKKRITFIIFEVWDNRRVRSIADFMALHQYDCFLITPRMLIPVHTRNWWYSHMDNFTRGWWGNGLCGIRGSKSMSMLWRMYHSDHELLATSYGLVWNTR